MAKCDICGKVKMSGNNVSHSNRHTKRAFNPNIRKLSVVQNGNKTRIKICTRCLRTMTKPARA